MFREQRRYGRDPEVVVRSKTTFNDPLKWKEPRLVFTCSWSDWFHKDADPWRDEAWEIIRRTPHLTYQILTKRPGRMMRHLPKDWGPGYPNVWLGVSIESQKFVYRALHLAMFPAAIRFISAEPLLGPLELVNVFDHSINGHLDLLRGEFRDGLYLDDAVTLGRIGWVIAGGESGRGNRPCELDWLRGLRDQCQEAGVPFFLKQLGGWPNARAKSAAVLDGVRHTEMPAHVR
jgi:protein gp37